MRRRRLAHVPIVSVARRQQIAELAEAVAAEHSPARERVDPEAIAVVCGMTVSFGDYGEAFDGMLEAEEGEFHIYCNATRCGRRDGPRARFTFAHELGHYYIDEHRHVLLRGRVPPHHSLCDYASPIRPEQEADHFAANLLMPAERFARAARRCDRGLGGVLALAERFGTSLTSTAIRWAELEVTPCAVIRWSWAGYSWKRLSSGTVQARFRRTVESPAQLAEGSPTRLALERVAPPAEGYFRAGTTASHWFPAVAHDGQYNAILMEEAIPLGRFGVLTLLWPEAGTYV